MRSNKESSLAAFIKDIILKIDCLDVILGETYNSLEADVRGPLRQFNYKNSTIIVHFYYLSRSFSFNTFYIAINYFIHGDGIVTREISLIFFDCILN